MSYDFYAELWKNLNSDFKEWINKKWNEVREDSRIHWSKKPEELRKKLENDKNVFHGIASIFLQGNEKVSLTQYAKLQKINQIFIEEHMKDLKDYTHSLLQKDRNYNRSKSPIKKVDLTENPKGAYKMFIHPSKTDWFGIHRDIKEQINWFDPMNNKKLHQILPRNSSFLKIVFKLKKPYISQDDEEFYIIDNPVCKDKVFKVPLVRASSWKGALRWVAYKQYVDKLETGKIGSEKWKEESGKLVRLFGDEKDEVDSWLNQVIADRLKNKKEDVEKGFGEYLRNRGYVGESGNRRGLLVFYPSFFDQIGLDVIAPHDRKTKTPARGPIYFETVPERTKGTFYLLYFPFDLLGKEGTEVEEEIKQDLAILKDAIPVMLTKYGFGAKTTAGYGVVENEINFQILPGMGEEKEDDKFGKEGSEFLKELDGLINRKGER